MLYLYQKILVYLDLNLQIEWFKGFEKRNNICLRKINDSNNKEIALLENYVQII